jgi:hypothetical protein
MADAKEKSRLIFVSATMENVRVTIECQRRRTTTNSGGHSQLCYAIAASPSSYEACDPNGIRTRVTAVKGRCPGPLDDRVAKAGQYRIAILPRKANCRALSPTRHATNARRSSSGVVRPHKRAPHGRGYSSYSCSERRSAMNATARAVAPRCWFNTSRAF